MNDLNWFDNGDLGNELQPPIEVPVLLDNLPNGREGLIFGYPYRDKEIIHKQGDNPYGYSGTCGIISCEMILRNFGIVVTETDLVKYCIDNGLCRRDGPPAYRGGTTVYSQARLLNDFGVPAEIQLQAGLSDLSNWVESGKDVIVAANAGVLWNDATYFDGGIANHAVVVTGVARSPDNNEILGFYITDSGIGKSGRFVDAHTMDIAWSKAGGMGVITMSRSLKG